MKPTTPRSIAFVLAFVVVLSGLKGIAALAHVDGGLLTLVTLPAVQVVATKPAEQRRM